jgi:hypothetical protein
MIVISFPSLCHTGALTKIITKHLMKERWEQWHRHVRELRFNLHVEVRWLTELWSEWRHFTKNESKKRILLSRLIRRYERRSMRHGIRTWAFSAKDQQLMILRHKLAELRPQLQHQIADEQNRCIQRIVNRLRYKQIHASFHKWLHHHTRSQRNEQVLKTIHQRLQRRHETTAYNAWYTLTKTTLHNRYLVKKTLLKMKLRQLLKCIVCWKMKTDKKLRIESILRRVLMKQCHYRRHTFLVVGWKSLVQHSKSMSFSCLFQVVVTHH